MQKLGRKLDDVVTATESSEYKSMCGSLVWASGWTRPDLAFDTHRMQKRQAAPRLKDCQRGAKVIEVAKATGPPPPCAHPGLPWRPRGDGVVGLGPLQ